MNIQFYTFSKRENSTAVPSGSGQTVSVNLKEGTSLMQPSFELVTSTFPTENYVKWDNRYYYITDVTYLANGLYRIDCTMDVLATYRSYIFNTSAFVAYSASDYDENIVDRRYSMDANVMVDVASASIITDAPAGTNDGTYILEYATSQSNYGPSGVVWLSPTSAQLIASDLNSSGFNSFLEEFAKQFNGAYDSVIGCRFVPFDWYGRGTGTQNVFLGGYDTGHLGANVQSTIEYSGNISIPWQFNDFRNLSPYTSLLIYLPAYGFLELNPADFFGESSIKVTLFMDGVTGIGTYIIGNKARCTADFSTPVSIGTVKSNAMSLIAGGISAVGAVATGGAALPVVGAIAGVLLSQARSIGNSGVSGGFAGVKASPSNWQNIYLYTICHNTNVEPNNFLNTIGRTLNQVVQLSTLSGYVQTADASVSAPIDENIKNMINSALDGGVYLE